MTAVSHVYTVSNVTTANPAVTVTDTPAAGDVLVLLIGTNSTNSKATAVSGCGATWSRVAGALSVNEILDVWIGTGATASGTVTATASATSGRALEVLMVSGTTATAVGVSTTGTGARTTPTQLAGNGQAVFGLSYSTDAASTVTALTPATGWTEQTLTLTGTTAFMGALHRTPTGASESHNFTAHRPSGNTYVSQVVLGGTRTNLVKNPSFETDITGYTFQTSTTLTRDTAEFSTGSASLKCVATVANARIAIFGATGSPAANADSIAVSVGQSVTFSAYTKRPAGALDHRVLIQWFNSSGAYIGDTNGTLTSVGNSWTRLSVSGVAPANAAKFGVALFNLGADTTTYTDGWLVEISDILGGYFDGSTVSTGMTNAWTGAVDASTSTQTRITVTCKKRESGSWVTHTAVPKAWTGSAWVIRRPKRWNGSAWVDLL